MIQFTLIALVLSKINFSLLENDVSFLCTDMVIITFEKLCQSVTPFQNPQTFIGFLRQTSSTVAIFKIKSLE
jgi:hypothetical protein